MSKSGLLKPDRDFTKEVDKQIPEAQELANVTASWKTTLGHANMKIEQCPSSDRQTHDTRETDTSGLDLSLLYGIFSTPN